LLHYPGEIFKQLDQHKPIGILDIAIVPEWLDVTINASIAIFEKFY
jgi:hypothetical protein